jgi:hypothetical protein
VQLLGDRCESSLPVAAVKTSHPSSSSIAAVVSRTSGSSSTTSTALSLGHRYVPLIPPIRIKFNVLDRRGVPYSRHPWKTFIWLAEGNYRDREINTDGLLKRIVNANEGDLPGH